MSNCEAFLVRIPHSCPAPKCHTSFRLTQRFLDPRALPGGPCRICNLGSAHPFGGALAGQSPHFFQHGLVIRGLPGRERALSAKLLQYSVNREAVVVLSFNFMILYLRKNDFNLCHEMICSRKSRGLLNIPDGNLSQPHTEQIYAARGHRSKRVRNTLTLNHSIDIPRFPISHEAPASYPQNEPVLLAIPHRPCSPSLAFHFLQHRFSRTSCVTRFGRLRFFLNRVFFPAIPVIPGNPTGNGRTGVAGG